MSLPVTTWLVAGLAVLFLVLTARVIQFRIAGKVSLGDGGDPILHRVIRAQGNLVETAPFFILLVFLAELQSPATWLLGVLSGLFLVGRVMHGFCLAFLKSNMPLRTGGMLLTLLPMAAMIVVDLAIVLR
ncbi:hypothetical protein C8N35_1011367 [Breoghania corrubedonensis]|uniref:MAPEG superfamily protein n=2 Tax=Breoghania corrubedonensis TaxID=665038 RepID=A0A2T5VHW9_9HYPH|nr:hypothetical protein C8N35_1011367 [Breoghania corrubedonensis]